MHLPEEPQQGPYGGLGGGSWVSVHPSRQRVGALVREISLESFTVVQPSDPNFD